MFTFKEMIKNVYFTTIQIYFYLIIVYQIYRVLLDNEVTDFIEFKVNVVSRFLQIQLKDSSELVNRVDFGCTYYGSDVVKSFLLYNGSPVSLSYVAILEENGEGEEKVNFHCKSC